MEDRKYIKRVNKRKLKTFDEYNSTSFAILYTVLFAAIFLFCSYSFETQSFNTTILLFSLIYFIELAYLLVIKFFMKKSILKSDKLNTQLRLAGVVMLLFVLTGNILSFIAGMYLINSNKTVEYRLCAYMLLTNICIILVSLINLFKEYVANTFFLGIGILLVLTLFYIACTFIVAKNVFRDSINKKIVWISIPLIISVLTGNVFALVLAIVIIKRCFQKNTEISIKWIDIIRRLFKNDTAILGFFIVVLLISISICSQLTFDYDIAIDNDYSKLLLSPSLQYPFGTDEFGRCVFTRIVFGAKISLLVGLAATLYPMIVGGILGAIAGYYPGRIDNVIMRLLDVLSAVPGILLSIVIIASLGANLFNIVLALGVGSIPSYARLVRASVLNIASSEFVEAAKAYGAKDSIIVFKHIIPNSLAPIIVCATISLGSAVLSTSALSYLGIGMAPHLPEWGNILRMGSSYLETHSYLAIFPGLAIVMIVLAFNFFGDGVRDALDPKMK